MKNTKRSGFTLVELLIVIVVIGVLSAMMMLSST
ncbi:MAG: type II secretion system protein, partial [Synergistaceae bacterium]|nr:type II secretion system protein [Synergistaceae bacterium]